jgi:Ras-related protein Rab-1A
MTQLGSFEALDDWFAQVDQHAPRNCVRLLVGNKADLIEQRQVDFEQAKAYAQQRNVLLLETSAKESTNVNEAFLALARQIKSCIK